jgi:TolB-like protein
LQTGFFWTLREVDILQVARVGLGAMGHLLSELKRRHIYRVGAAYVVVAWALTQVVEILAQVYTLPLWIAQTAIALLAIGFPVALIVAWTIESKPHEAVAAAVRSKSGAVDWALFGAVAVVIVLIGYQQIAGPSTNRQTGVDAAREAAASPATAVSLAVLPFANMSDDASQEFFSDGMTEEITSALARIPDLRVVARTSAFEFKGQNRNIQSIGQQLNATHLIEGSVRKAGDRVRITVQLIKADDGTHMWSENYDRQLTDVFAIQEEIARNIATSFNMRLGLAPGQNLVSNRTENLEVYQDFLQGKAWLRARLSPASGPYLERFESVVARDPAFAPAWAHLARAYSLEPGQNREVVTLVDQGDVEKARGRVKALLDRGEMAGRMAIRLDPENASGYWGMAQVASNRGQWAPAEDYAKKALELDPNDPDALLAAGNASLRTGHLERASLSLEKARVLEPLVPAFNLNSANVLLAMGRGDAAIARLESMPATSGRRNMFLARAYAAQGRYAEAADTVLLTRTTNVEIRKFLEDTSRLLRSAPTKVADPQALPPYMTEYNFVYAHVGAIDRVMEYAERQLEIGYPQDIGSILWTPNMVVLRKTERFKAHMRNAGLVDHWKARGWPDLCRPTAGDDFDCD